MRNVMRIALGALVLTLMLSGVAQALEIFVWEHDNGRRSQDPVFNQSYTATQSLLRTLTELEEGMDLEVTHNRSLPEDLSDYDLVMTCLSWYCPG